mgnify:CR=1 FL=1
MIVKRCKENELTLNKLYVDSIVQIHKQGVPLDAQSPKIISYMEKVATLLYLTKVRDAVTQENHLLTQRRIANF